jgi:hypothetical protein
MRGKPGPRRSIRKGQWPSWRSHPKSRGAISGDYGDSGPRCCRITTGKRCFSSTASWGARRSTRETGTCESRSGIDHSPDTAPSTNADAGSSIRANRVERVRSPEAGATDRNDPTRYRAARRPDRRLRRAHDRKTSAADRPTGGNRSPAIRPPRCPLDRRRIGSRNRRTTSAAPRRDSGNARKAYLDCRYVAMARMSSSFISLITPCMTGESRRRFCRTCI